MIKYDSKKYSIKRKKQLVSKYLTEERTKTQVKSTDINILLNRIEINKKMSLEENYIFLQQLLQD